MAAALRSAARKICGHAFERPQALLRTAASAAIKEEQRRLLPGGLAMAEAHFPGSPPPNHQVLLIIRARLSSERSLKSRSCSLLSVPEDKPPTYFVFSRFICLAMMSLYILTLGRVSILYYKSTMSAVEDE
ncbi:uncharacterized protein LOC125548062 [Triticum urartu]|uniref:uncharacterized protein LOC125548062 n=1 Tax=Triticum urartu TaxID=4572 RepID=UPI0020430AE8|nr:uncharacterized protein LOC125548062 [Triticum urartu]